MAVSLAAKAGAAVALPAALWSVWYSLVLRQAVHSSDASSPRWLRVFVSGLLYRFAENWLNFTHDLNEKIASGRIDPNRQSIITLGPHGQYTVSALAFFSHWVAKDFPFKNMHAVVADVLLSIPVVADYLCLVKTKPASFGMMDSLLKKGHTLAAYPGGIFEQVRTDAHEEKLFYPRNLTFVRLAIKHGVDLLPLYCFGENQLWPTSTFATRLNMAIYNTFGVGNVVLHSPVCWLPTSMLLPSPLLLPKFGAPVHARFGDPVPTGPPDADPSDEKVLAVFERLAESMGQIFKEHAGDCLPPYVAAKGLTITLREGKGQPERVWKFEADSQRSRL